MEKAYKTLKILILVLSMVAVLLGAWVLYEKLKDNVHLDAATGQTETETRELVPDFTVYDLQGNPVKLSDFRGKPVILNFWASWCGPCKSEMPTFEEKYKQYGDQIQFMMVNLTDGSQETVGAGSSYVISRGFTFPVYYDTDIQAAYAYSVTSIPVTYFVDAEGYLVAWYPGAMSEDILQRAIDTLLEA